MLDGCCKAGGAAYGYMQAANDLGVELEITGIDIEPQPNYPYNFIQCDLVEFLQTQAGDYHVIHTSPPCQKYSTITITQRNNGKIYRDILTETRQELIKLGVPSVIENVMPAPIKSDCILRGDMFGLRVLKQRKFECINWFMMAPILPKKIGSVTEGDFAQVVGVGQKRNNQMKQLKGVSEGKSVSEIWSEAMGINWMTRKEMAEAIPPAYTRYIGKYLIEYYLNKQIN